jgi:hypothetical protein
MDRQVGRWINRMGGWIDRVNMQVDRQRDIQANRLTHIPQYSVAKLKLMNLVHASFREMELFS